MEYTILQRIRRIIDYMSISDNEFSKQIGKSQSTIASLFKRGNDPSSDIISAIIKRYNQLSVEWLLTGEGEMLKQQEPNRKEVNLHSRNTYQNDGDITIGATVNKPQVPYGIVAGNKSSDCEKKLSEALIEIKHLRDIIESKDKLLSEKERLISILMKK